MFNWNSMGACIRIVAFLGILCVATNIALGQDSCEVKEAVRPDGIMIRSVDFETIHVFESVEIKCAMYAIDKDYFLVVHIDNPEKILVGKELQDDISIQMADSTNILLTYSSKSSIRSKKTYDGYFKIKSADLGYIEKYAIVRINYMIDDQKRFFLIKDNKDVLQRHYTCLRSKK